MKNENGYTLVELIVVIALIWFLTMLIGWAGKETLELENECPPINGRERYP